MVDESSRTDDQQANKKPGYRDIANVLSADIRSGVHAPGQKLPPASEIASSRGASKSVVHNALRVLQSEGLVDIRPGDAVYVRRPWTPILRDANARLSKRQWDDGLSIWASDLGNRKLHIDATLSVAEEVPAEVRELLDVPRYRVRHRIFTVDDVRVEIGTSYLDAEVTSGTAIDELDTGQGGTFARLKEIGFDVTTFREDIRPRTPTVEEAKALQIASSRPVFEIVRKNATAEGHVVEVTHMVLVADLFVLRYHVTS